MIHFGKWALRFATLPNGRIVKDVRAGLERLPHAEKARIVQLLDAGEAFELWQTSEGLWNCRVRVGVLITHCARKTIGDAIADCLSAHGTEVVP